jgi:cytochrome P450
MGRQAQKVDISFESAAFKRDPFPIYAKMREHSPIVNFHASGPLGGNAFAIMRYADVSSLMKDSSFVKDTTNAGLPPLKMPKFIQPLTRNMLGMDDPDHARLKRLVMAAFTPRRVEQMRQRTALISAQLLDGLAGQPHFDLIADYGLRLPVTVISDLLGVPTADQAKFARWSGALIRAGRTKFSGVHALPQIIQFLSYLKYLIALKRREPQDDLLSALVIAESEGDKLSHEELMAMIAILLSAGHETTVNLIGNGIFSLLTHPDAMAELREQPSIINTAVDELVRFSGPVSVLTHRYAKENVELGDVYIPKGALVFGVVASANRDEQQFEHADKLILTRTPNRHLGFGEGGHYCIGASLARMEGEIAINHLLSRFPKLNFVHPAESYTWTAGLNLRGLDKLLVKNGV